MRGSPERGDAVVGRAITDQCDDSALRLGELHANGGRQAEAQATRCREVIAAWMTQVHALPECRGCRGRFLDIDGIVRGDRIEYIEQRFRVQVVRLVGDTLRRSECFWIRPGLLDDFFGQHAQGFPDVADQRMAHGCSCSL